MRQEEIRPFDNSKKTQRCLTYVNAQESNRGYRFDEKLFKNSGKIQDIKLKKSKVQDAHQIKNIDGSVTKAKKKTDGKVRKKGGKKEMIENVGFDLSEIPMVSTFINMVIFMSC